MLDTSAKGDIIYLHNTGVIYVTLGQNTGTNWTTANFVFVPQGTPNSAGIPAISFTSYPAFHSNGLSSGLTLAAYLAVNNTKPPIAIGTTAVGSIWVQYTIASSTTPQYTQIAIVNIKAT